MSLIFFLEIHFSLVYHIFWSSLISSTSFDRLAHFSSSLYISAFLSSPKLISGYFYQFQHGPYSKSNYNISTSRPAFHVFVDIRVPAEFRSALLQYGFPEKSNKVWKMRNFSTRKTKCYFLELWCAISRWLPFCSVYPGW